MTAIAIGCRSRIASVREVLRNAWSKSEHEPTRGHSIDCGSGHLTQVFRDIGCTVSWAWSLVGAALQARFAHWSQWWTGGVQSGKRNVVSSRAKSGFNSVSSGRTALKKPLSGTARGGDGGVRQEPGVKGSPHGAEVPPRFRTVEVCPRTWAVTFALICAGAAVAYVAASQSE
jgi:hypothetical protein